MTRTIRRIATTVLARETWRLTNAPDSPTGFIYWCEACQAEREFVEPESAAVRWGVTRRAVYRAVEAGTVHYIETAEGALWLCSTLGATAKMGIAKADQESPT